MAPWRSHFVPRYALPVLACVMVAKTGSTQQTATLRGVVLDRVTGLGVPGAQIVVLETKKTTTSDSSGKYRILDVPIGTSHLMVGALGFIPRQVSVELMTGAITDKPIQLDSISRGRTTEAQSLPGMAVSAPATPFNYRLVDFERRRQTGRGQYLTEDEIVKSGAYNIADAVKNMRGVLYDCGGGAGCYIRMSNAPMRCLPEFIVDNQVMNDFGPSTPIRDIVGLELYTGPSEVPGEYAGRNAGCGVVVIWTRSGPTKKRNNQ
jgi:hypothetical protein